MNIDCWFKVPTGYKFLKLDIAEYTNDKLFYEKLKIKLLIEVEKIRADIENILNKYDDKVYSLSKPRVEDPIDNAKLCKLDKARSDNIESISKLKNLLQYDECIVCEGCKSLMYKTPINVRTIKVGNKFMIDDDEKTYAVKYDYICSKCYRMEEEEAFIFKQRNRKLRDELLTAGERFVPDELGFYSYMSDKAYDEWKEKNTF